MVKAAMMTGKQEPDNALWLMGKDLAMARRRLNLPYLVEYAYYKFHISAFECSGCPSVSVRASDLSPIVIIDCRLLLASTQESLFSSRTSASGTWPLAYRGAWCSDHACGTKLGGLRFYTTNIWQRRFASLSIRQTCIGSFI